MCVSLCAVCVLCVCAVRTLVLDCKLTPRPQTFHDAYLNTAVFQGFSLALMDRTMTSSVAMVMEGVGLDPRKPFIPTHLEVVQILDVSTVPHLLLSPLQCTLYPCDIMCTCGCMGVYVYLCVHIHVCESSMCLCYDSLCVCLCDSV